MGYIYVCLFSNGLVKVGKSVNPDARIASHRGRVSCLRVTLSEKQVFECKGDMNLTERALINACKSNAEQVSSSEWFSGLDFEYAKNVAAQCAATEYKVPEDGALMAQIAAEVVKCFGSQTAVAKALGYDDVRNVSNWTTGKRWFPTVHCVTIERESANKLTRKKLRPLDYAKHWPELAKKR